MGVARTQSSYVFVVVTGYFEVLMYIYLYESKVRVCKRI
jgi:hypothetical protein